MRENFYRARKRLKSVSTADLGFSEAKKIYINESSAKCNSFHYSNISHLNNLDIDLHMPSDINFDHFTTHDFHSNQDIINCLSSNSLFFLKLQY